MFNPLSLIVIGMVQWISQDFAGGAELNEKTKEFLLYKDVSSEENNNKNYLPQSIARENFDPTYELNNFKQQEDGKKAGVPYFIKQENHIIGLQTRTRGDSF